MICRSDARDSTCNGLEVGLSRLSALGAFRFWQCSNSRARLWSHSLPRFTENTLNTSIGTLSSKKASIKLPKTRAYDKSSACSLILLPVHYFETLANEQGPARRPFEILAPSNFVPPKLRSLRLRVPGLISLLVSLEGPPITHHALQ